MDITEKIIGEFASAVKYFINGGFFKLLTGIEKNINYDYIDELSEVYSNDLSKMKFQDPLIFIIKDKKRYDELYIPSKYSKEYKNSKDYLKRIKEILNLPNTVESLLSKIEEKNNNYAITNDNFKKMILLLYRIISNIPVIIMGETGCGKTSLIIKLNQIANNGENTLKIININPEISDVKLCEIMKK